MASAPLTGPVSASLQGDSEAQTAFRATSLRQLEGAQFDSELFFQALAAARDAAPSLRTPIFGDALMHGDVVSSTQTILDKYRSLIVGFVVFRCSWRQPRNTSLCEALPNGFVFAATRQVAGRGRGGNAWISPSGCLQFSFVLRHASASTVVFVQYIMGLAVVEALRRAPGYEALPVRVKWPNDIYVAGEDGLPPRKIGGVLVTSSFMHGTFSLVVGCGVNVNNSEPTDCVNDVIVRHNKKHGTALSLLRKACRRFGMRRRTRIS